MTQTIQELVTTGLPLSPVYQRYDWGTRDQIIKLLDLPHPGGNEPIAELWMGAHPGLPTPLQQPVSGCLDLCALIEQHPQTMLGSGHQLFGGRLPYLFKVLSAARALSIQVHPSKVQAEAGFRHDNAMGVPMDAGQRNYRDDNHKPELLVALTPFTAMAGFRAPAEVAGLLELSGSRALRAWARPLRERGLAALEALFTWCLAQEMEVRTMILRDLMSDLPSDGPYSVVARLHDQFGEDMGVIAPLLLHVHQLHPGEALYLGSGVPHAYLEGTGLEVMANSDNVLRGGLTHKHMDREELLAITRFEPDTTQVMQSRITESDGLTVTDYPVPCRDFQLQILQLEAHTKTMLNKASGPELLLVLSGMGRLGSLNLEQGSIVFLPPVQEPRHLTCGQSLTLARVSTALHQI